MKSFNSIMAASLLGASAVSLNGALPATARGLTLYESDSAKVVASGEMLVRSESWDWFGDTGDAYSFAFQRTRLNLSAKAGNIELFAQPQYISMWNLPDDASPAGKGPSGMGALYYAHNGEDNPDSAGFHQAWVRLNGLPLEGSIQLGRMTYASGLEHMNNADGMKFNALKDMRLGDRLVSSFEWSAFARAFDGVRIEGKLPGGLPLTLSWFYPTQGGWEKDFNDSMEDVRLASLAITAPKGFLLPDAEIGFFTHNYRDERACTQRVDNSGISTGRADIDVTAIGVHLVGIRPTGGNQWDYLLWGVYETGDWYELEHSAYAFAAETGFQWMQVPMKPWLRVGYFLGSGDDDPSDGDHETFFQLIPGTRKYQLFPYYDLQNNESFYAQLILAPHKDVKIRFDYALNRLAERADRWYMGTGATQKKGNVFGYIGRSSGGDSNLSQEASVMLSYTYNKHLDINIFYAHIWGGDVIENIYADDKDADYFSVEATLKF